MPFLPPPGEPNNVDIAQALRDPKVVASTQAPYLPPAHRPAPTPSAPPVFDAKLMVDATRRNKVDNPAYGQLPTGTPEGRAAAEAARARMRGKRRRNKLLGWAMAVIFIGLLAGAGYALYTMYEEDQDAHDAERAANPPTPLVNGEEPGALTPLGEQTQVIGALNDLNSGAAPSAGALVGAADAAQNAVDQINGSTGSTAPSSSVAMSDVLPPGIMAVATGLQPLDGFTRYLVVVDDAVRAEPLATPGWLSRLQRLPQSAPDSSGFTELPAVDSGEIAIAVQTSGDQVTRLVVLGTDPAIHVDL
jgi:hypothetical protein